jgi:hypothetical protein
MASRLCWRLLISDLERARQRSRLVRFAHLACRLDQRFHDRPDLVSALSREKLLVRAVQAGVVIGGGDQRVRDQRHHIVDLADHPRADLVDAVGGLDMREIGLVDLLEIGLAQRAMSEALCPVA